MLNSDLKLNKDFFKKPKVRATREGFGDALVLAGRKNPNVVVLTGDLKESVKVDAFAREFPERFFDVGVAEQNLVTIASGLGISGKIPFAASYAAFSPGRNWEQIRTTICYNDSNVKLVGSHAGLSVGADGATHQMLEDIALMRALPNMRVFSPCDAEEASKITEALTHFVGPAYIRLSRTSGPDITTLGTPFTLGKVQSFWESKKPQCTIFATGPILSEALYSAEILEKDGIQVDVINVHSIKPLDERGIISSAKRAGCVVSVEDHQMAGGLGSAISELLAEKLPLPQEFVGVRDSFGESGEPAELWKKYSVDHVAIVRAVKKVIARR